MLEDHAHRRTPLMQIAPQFCELCEELAVPRYPGCVSGGLAFHYRERRIPMLPPLLLVPARGELLYDRRALLARRPQECRRFFRHIRARRSCVQEVEARAERGQEAAEGGESQEEIGARWRLFKKLEQG